MYNTGNEFIDQRLPEYQEFLVANSPKFKKEKWTFGDRTLFVRLCDGTNCQETKNIQINHGIPVDGDGNDFIFLEIVDKKKCKTVRARIESLVGIYEVVSNMRGRIRTEKDAPVTLLEAVSRYLHEHGKDLTTFFEHWEACEISENGFIKFIGNNGNDSMCIRVADCLCSVDYEPKPGEVDERIDYCYDLKWDSTEENQLPGAHTTITYQHLLKNGEINPTPWRIKIKNYILVRDRQDFNKEKIKELSVNLSHEKFQDIVSFLDGEQIKAWRYAMEQKWGFALLNNIEEPLDFRIHRCYGR